MDDTTQAATASSGRQRYQVFMLALCILALVALAVGQSVRGWRRWTYATPMLRLLERAGFIETRRM